MGKLQDKVILVTGAASGIGKAEAETAISEGAKVVLSDVRQDGVQNVAATLGSNAIGLRQDVSLESDWERVVAKTIETFGRIDGLVNNAGLYLPGAIEATTGEDFDKQFAVNQRGTFPGYQGRFGADAKNAQSPRHSTKAITTLKSA